MPELHRSRHRVSWVAVCAMAATLLAPPRAGWAGEADRTKARPAYALAVRAAEVGDYEGALRHADEVVRIYRVPKTLRFRADILEALGRPCAASEDLRNALALGPKTAERKRIELTVVRTDLGCARTQRAKLGRLNQSKPRDPKRGVAAPEHKPTAKEDQAGFERRASSGLRAIVGGVSDGFVGGAELSLVAIRWKHLYWETLRVGGVSLAGAVWGTALYYPFDIGDGGAHELRTGLHLTFDGGAPMPPGLALSYLWRFGEHWGLDTGLLQIGVPFGVALVSGVSYTY